MTHLGDRVTPLVDGRLAPDAAERALAHVAVCRGCAESVAAERAARRLVHDAPDPQPSAELVSRLLAMGGPEGPMGPRPGHVPGTPRPAALPAPGAGPASRRPDGRHDPARPGATRRGRRARFASAAVGALSLASVGLVGLLLLGGATGRQDPGIATAALGAAGSLTPIAASPVASGSLGGAASPAYPTDRLDDGELDALRDQGWPCPTTLAGDLRLVDARALEVDGSPVLHLTYSDGSSTVSVVEHRGRLAAAHAATFSQVLAAGAQLAGRDEIPWHGVWQSGDVVVAVVADAPPEVLTDVVASLPHQDPADGWWHRVERGADAVAALLGDR